MLVLVQDVCPLNLVCKVIKRIFASARTLDAAKVIFYGVLLVVSEIRLLVVGGGKIKSEYSTGQALVLEAVITTSLAASVIIC